MLADPREGSSGIKRNGGLLYSLGVGGGYLFRERSALANLAKKRPDAVPSLGRLNFGEMENPARMCMYPSTTTVLEAMVLVCCMGVLSRKVTAGHKHTPNPASTCHVNIKRAASEREKPFHNSLLTSVSTRAPKMMLASGSTFS